jgi:hypothetical protein
VQGPVQVIWQVALFSQWISLPAPTVTASTEPSAEALAPAPILTVQLLPWWHSTLQRSPQAPSHRAAS